MSSNMYNPAILIVDDDVISRMVLNKILTRNGYTIFEADNGYDALDLINSDKNIEHIILDLNMPVLDGYSFIELLNSQKLSNRLNVIITSCWDESHFTTNVQERNLPIDCVKAYFKKPVDFELLVNTLRCIEPVAVAS